MPFLYKIFIPSTRRFKEISIPYFDEQYDNYERFTNPKFQNYEIHIGEFEILIREQ
jgi:hypothetical protein